MKQLLIFSLYSLLQLSCQTVKRNQSSGIADNNLIKDCPEELISNQMPGTGKSTTAKQYYIYKGIRKEIREFDSVWVNKHCKVKVTIVH